MLNKRAFLDRFAKRFNYVRVFNPGDALAALGKSPDIVVDVGVRNGTPWLYRTFADSRFLLIDPQRGGAELLKVAPRNFEFVNCGLGAAPDTLILNEQGGKSTVLQRTALTQEDVDTTYEIQLDTLDNVLDRFPQGNIGIKIDTEGFELEVMRGLTRHLHRVQFILAEVSVKNRFENSYTFAEFMDLMASKGLRFYNVANLARPQGRSFFDCIFLQHEDPLFS
jgi:FkbM family methyltransferase